MLEDETLGYCFGYQDQLERARRALERMHGPCSTDVEFQDSVWSFFQHCWHLHDWLRHDPLVPEDAKVSVLKRVSRSAALQTCRALCHGNGHLNGHLSVNPARHFYPATTVIADQRTSAGDSMANEGVGILVAGAAFASECLAEWEVILSGEGLAVARRARGD